LSSPASVLLDLGDTVFLFPLIWAAMQITEVKIVPVDEERLRAYVSITFDDCFVISEIKLIRGKKGYAVSMPRRKRGNGTYIDIVAPINNETRQMIEKKIFAVYQAIADEPVKRRVLK
jgi:stage V sporulation protein G